MTERDQTVGVNVSTTPLDRAAAVCRSFTADWRGDRTDLTTYLKRVPTGARPALLRKLVEYEVRARRQAGDPPST